MFDARPQIRAGRALDFGQHAIPHGGLAFGSEMERADSSERLRRGIDA
jgi:hypothetical protein